MRAAIWYESDGYRIDGPRLLGRHAAGHGFLGGLVRHGRSNRHIAVVRSHAGGKEFADFVRSIRPEARAGHLLLDQFAALRDIGLLYYPGPDIAAQAGHRHRFAARAYSICGVTHTIASAGVMQAICDWLVAPVRCWDAVVCTSRSVRAVIGELLDEQQAWLAGRLGASRFERPQLPVIPLGVDCAAYAAAADGAGRAAARAQLGIAPEAVAILFLGRLSFVAKASPIPLYLAAARIHRERPLVLVDCGWHENDAEQKAFSQAHACLAGAVPRIVLDGRKPQERSIAWACADIFCSFADNIQETFGLAPIEAMAAGLPAVVSDWDGYRDTVRDGIDGFRIPTVMAGAGAGSDIAVRYAVGQQGYAQFVGRTSQLVAVDVDAATEALRRLAGDADLRRRLGEAGRRRAREAFDWSQVVRQYEALWDELAEMRRSADEPAAAILPVQRDPAERFACYASRELDAQMQFIIGDGAADVDLPAVLALAIADFPGSFHPSCEMLQAVIATVRGTPATGLAAIAAALAPALEVEVRRALAFLLKLGMLRFV
jgi:alpha-maltose-1-phosphate synthase